MSGIWTVGDGGEEPITSAKAERERHKGRPRPNSSSASNERERKLAGEIGKESWTQSKEDPGHKAQPMEALEHLS